MGGGEKGLAMSDLHGPPRNTAGHQMRSALGGSRSVESKMDVVPAQGVKTGELML